MVVIAAPDALHVILNVRVIVTTLGGPFVDSNTMEVVRQALQGLVLILQQRLLVLDLLLEAEDLVLNLGSVCAEHLLD